MTNKSRAAAEPRPTRSKLDAARAQGRAKTRLTYLYPEIYRALYEEEKAKLLKEQPEEAKS